MSSKRDVVEEFNSCPSWFETVNFVSALAIPSNLGLRLHTSCSTSRSAGLDSNVLSFTQTKAVLSQLKNGRRGFPKSNSLAGAGTDAPGVLSEFSVQVIVFEFLRSIIKLCVVCRCRASQLVEREGV